MIGKLLRSSFENLKSLWVSLVFIQKIISRVLYRPRGTNGLCLVEPVRDMAWLQHQWLVVRILSGGEIDMRIEGKSVCSVQCNGILVRMDLRFGYARLCCGFCSRRGCKARCHQVYVFRNTILFLEVRIYWPRNLMQPVVPSINVEEWDKRCFWSFWLCINHEGIFQVIVWMAIYRPDWAVVDW